MPRNGKKGGDEQAGAPLWMVTFGDLMSLLLTFFVLLLSFSTINEEEFREAMSSLRGALGVMPHYVTAIQVVPTQRPGRPIRRSIERLARRLRRQLQVTGRQQDVKLEYEQGGLKISLPNAILFDKGKALLRPEAGPILGDIASLLADVPNARIDVRGHTDNDPLKDTSLYRDNYDLSFARAKRVMQYVCGIDDLDNWSQRGRIPRSQFEVTGCGPAHPVATNDTPEGQQANRRVEIWVRGDLTQTDVNRLREEIQPGRPPAPAAANPPEAAATQTTR